MAARGGDVGGGAFYNERLHVAHQQRLHCQHCHRRTPAEPALAGGRRRRCWRSPRRRIYSADYLGISNTTIGGTIAQGGGGGSGGTNSVGAGGAGGAGGEVDGGASSTVPTI